MLWVRTALVFSLLFFMPGLLEQFETPKIEAVRVCGLGALALALLASTTMALRASWHQPDERVDAEQQQRSLDAAAAAPRLNP